MSKGHRVISRKTKNGSDIDKEIFERKILAASRSKGGLSFSFEEITKMTKLPEKELAHYLNQRVHLSCKGHYA